MPKSIYKDISERTGGNIYIGVVGPVRSGKSTFISRFMNVLVVPSIEDEFRRERAVDELPQSAAGKTIMTTEPKFVPEEAVSITVDESVEMNVRLIDCVGYIVPGAKGYIENEAPRMVKTPWFDEEVPFNMAAEERVINELKSIKKPFTVVLNCSDPSSEESKELACRLSEKYGCTVTPLNCLYITEENIKELLSDVLMGFPVREIGIKLPKWLASLDNDHYLKKQVFEAVRTSAENISCMGDLDSFTGKIGQCESVSRCSKDKTELGSGTAYVTVELGQELFYKVLGETTGIELSDEGDLMPCMIELARIKKEYEKVSTALEQVRATGYGIVMPSAEELTLEEPEIVKQGGKFGVRLKASAPSIHMTLANINTEVNPIVGSEKQSEDLVRYLLREFEENPTKIWESNIFGKSLHELVNEGLHNKLSRMPDDARAKLQEAIQRIINDGCNGLICLIL